MKTESIKAAYRRYAAVYDLLFGGVFAPGRRATVHMVNREANQRILEVGVGTGLSLPFYRTDASVFGIDLSIDMLEVARRRADRDGLEHVHGLLEMDAQNMAFSDGSFDAVVAMYVASVVSDPARMLAEMRRVCVPGGDIVIVNHFTSTHPVMRAVEMASSPLSGLIGFRPHFELDALLGMARMRLIEVRDVNLFGYWRLVRFRNEVLDDQTQTVRVAREGVHPLELDISGA
jgi:phosphatidylethanolamine/phosphatidyl-N-methylethanolamine N-methyltransferase